MASTLYSSCVARPPCLAVLLFATILSLVRCRFEWSNALLVTFASQTLGIDCQKAADRVRLERIQVLSDTMYLQVTGSLRLVIWMAASPCCDCCICTGRGKGGR